jgi:tRNA pseudouridine55 synthase
MSRAAARRTVDGILLLDKPDGITSNTALQRVKRIYQAEKAGHTGSLDPIATGLLPICLGQATKLSSLLLDGDKRYRVVAQLGAKTSTGDREGEVVAQSDPSQLSRHALEELLPKFLGQQLQVPPMYSALKHQGKRLYELARAGMDVERAPREVFIRDVKLLDFQPGSFALEVTCSKGTYIRTLVEDIAARLGELAHVAELRRIGAAPFWAPQMVSYDALELAAQQGVEALDGLLLPVVAGAALLPKVEVDDERAFYLARGQAVRIGSIPDAPAIAVVSAAGQLLGIGRRDLDGLLAPSRWMT